MKKIWKLFKAASLLMATALVLSACSGSGGTALPSSTLPGTEAVGGEEIGGEEKGVEPQDAIAENVQYPEETIIGAWYLSFPLSEQTATSATINSIFDHSMTTGSYPDDGVTVAYTGEKGERTDDDRGKKVWDTHYGFRNAGKSDFIVNGQYAGGGNANSGDFQDLQYLYYDGHPGVDYRAGEGTQLYAPADGTIVEIQDSAANAFYIDHGNGYRSYFLHTGTYNANNNTWSRNNKTGKVKRNAPIAKVGGAGGYAPHLHYELQRKVETTWVPVDPYGWAGSYPDLFDPYGAAGSYPDPYTAAVSTNLWTNSGTQWNFDSFGNYEGWLPINVESFSVHHGAFFIDPEALDPYIQSPPLLNVNSSNFNTVEVRMKSGAPDGSGAIYFTTANSPKWGEDKRVNFTVTNDGNWRVYTVRMEGKDGNSLWLGSITAIRVDPSNSGRTGSSSDIVGFDYIKLTN